MRVWMRFCSFAVICFLVYVHLGPAKWQPPRTGLGWQLDHFLGYFAATSIVWLAWPRRPFLVGGFMMGTSALLEALQTFTPDRHADFYAALFGAGGALTQALLAELFIRVRRRAKTWIKIKNPNAPAATRANFLGRERKPQS